MRNLVVTEFVTLDGGYRDPFGSEKTENGGWAQGFWSGETAKYKQDEILNADAVLLGRKTFDEYSENWKSIKGTVVGDRMTKLPKYVVSKTMNNPKWENTSIIRENIVEEIKKLKQGDGKEIIIEGSNELIKTLREHDLIDRYRLLVHPVMLGDREKIFDSEIDMHKLKLVTAKPIENGVIALEYQREREQEQKRKPQKV